jgi:hypothetical protein
MSEAYSDLGPPIPPSTYSAPPTRRSPNPKLVKIISELGLRYRPLASADQEAHAAQVALLVQDLADADPHQLARAAQEYARTERFMPKACDLLAIINRAKSDIDPNGEENLKRLAAKYNAADWFTRRDVEWVARGSELKLEPVGRR